MKIYISGKISGLPFDEVKAKFERAERKLARLGYEPVNPLNNGLTVDDSWAAHMVKDIETLFTCEGILLLEDWQQSKGARIEKNIAEEMGFKILHELTLSGSVDFLTRIKNAVLTATGLEFEEYITSNQKFGCYNARVLFAKQAKRILNDKEIGHLLNRHRTTVIAMLKNYDNEIRYNYCFKRLAEIVVAEMNNY